MPEQRPDPHTPNQKPEPPASGMGRFTWLFIFLSVLLISQLVFQQWYSTAEEISWTEFQQEMLYKGDVERIKVINKEKAEVFIKEDRLGTERYENIKSSSAGPHFTFTIGSVDNFEETLKEMQAEVPLEERITIEYVKETNWLGNILNWVLPFALFIGLWLFIINRMRPGRTPGGGSLFDFGKVSTTAFRKTTSSVTFDDVAGLEEVKVEIKEIVDFLKNPERYTRLGAKIPKGVILIGPPGTGKTLLAKAVAGEAGVPFFPMSGSEFVEMFVGVGASRVRDLFKKAKQNSPSIIFIDEIDAIGRSRGKAMSLQSNDERENTLNQLLAEMDGFEANTGVIVLAATNRGEILDRALLRPGRFDRQIFLNLPTLTERRAIFKVHTKPLKLAEEIDPGSPLLSDTRFLWC